MVCTHSNTKHPPAVCACFEHRVHSAFVFHNVTTKFNFTSLEIEFTKRLFSMIPSNYTTIILSWCRGAHLNIEKCTYTQVRPRTWLWRSDTIDKKSPSKLYAIQKDLASQIWMECKLFLLWWSIYSKTWHRKSKKSYQKNRWILSNLSIHSNVIK